MKKTLFDLCTWDVRESSSKTARKGHYSPESFLHPAKMSIGLCRAMIETYTSPGQTILDPMAGIGTTLVEAMLMGRNAIGVELEERFAVMARLNMAQLLWNRVIQRREERVHYGYGVALTGDARSLALHLEIQSENAVFSPPYPGTNHPMGRTTEDIQAKYPHDFQVSRDPENIANLALGISPPQASSHQLSAPDGVVFSPPFGEENRGGTPGYLANKALPGWKSNGHFKDEKTLQVSQDPANIDNKKLEIRPDIALSSPPYASRLGEGCGWVKNAGWGGDGMHAISVDGYTGGTADKSNLGNLRLEPAAALLSPPYSNRYEKREGTWPNGDPRDSHNYSSSPDQVGATKNRRTYLAEMRKVYHAIFDVLKPGGIMVLITKDFVKQHERVPLGGHTVELCRQVGFTFRPCPEGCDMTLYPHTHKCSLTNKSFWIRNQEQKFLAVHPDKPSPYVNHEDVLVFSK